MIMSPIQLITEHKPVCYIHTKVYMPLESSEGITTESADEIPQEVAVNEEGEGEPAFLLEYAMTGDIEGMRHS